MVKWVLFVTVLKALADSLVFSIVSALVAREKGRNPFWWWLYGFISPAIAIIDLLLFREEVEKENEN